MEMERSFVTKPDLSHRVFHKKFGVDYEEVFAPVASSQTLRLLLSVAGIKRYSIEHYDNSIS